MQKVKNFEKQPNLLGRRPWSFTLLHVVCCVFSVT